MARVSGSGKCSGRVGVSETCWSTIRTRRLTEDIPPTLEDDEESECLPALEVAKIIRQASEPSRDHVRLSSRLSRANILSGNRVSGLHDFSEPRML